MVGYRARQEAVTELAATAGITPSTADIAATTGIPVRTVARIRAGETVALRTAEWLAAELGSRVAELFDEVEVRP